MRREYLATVVFVIVTFSLTFPAACSVQSSVIQSITFIKPLSVSLTPVDPNQLV